MRTRRHRGILAVAVQSFSSTTRRTSHHRAGGVGRRRDGAGFTPEEPSRTTRTRKTIRMMRSATFGSSAPFYSAISRPGNSVNSAQIWSHSNVSSSLAAVLLLAPELALVIHVPYSHLSLQWTSSNLFLFKCFALSSDGKQKNLLDFNNKCQDPVRILLKLSTFGFYLPPNLHSFTSSNMDSLLYFLNYSLYLLSLHLSLSTISVCPCQSLWSVCEPRYISWCIGCKYVSSRKARLWIAFPVLHQRFILMFCVPPSGSFQCSKMFPQHVPRLWDAPPLSVTSWRIVNYLIVDLECPRKPRKQWDKWCIVVVVACFSSCFCKREIYLARSSSMHLKQKVMPIWLLQYFVAMLMLSSVFLVLLPISGGRKLHCRAIAV